MNRLRPIGWRNESYRHFLAAKGISTRKSFMGKISGKDLPIQVHQGIKKEDLRFELDENGIPRRFLPDSRYGSTFKPRPRGVKTDDDKWKLVDPGAFWTSSHTPGKEHVSDWKRWSSGENFKDADVYVFLRPKEDAKVFELKTADDFRWLIEKYPKKFPLAPGQPRHRLMDRDDVDWQAVSKDWDAVRLDQEAFWKFRMGLGDSEWDVVGPSTYSWDAESTAWFNPAALEVVQDELSVLGAAELENIKHHDEIRKRYRHDEWKMEQERLDNMRNRE